MEDISVRKNQIKVINVVTLDYNIFFIYFAKVYYLNKILKIQRVKEIVIK